MFPNKKTSSLLDSPLFKLFYPFIKTPCKQLNHQLPTDKKTPPYDYRGMKTHFIRHEMATKCARTRNKNKLLEGLRMTGRCVLEPYTLSLSPFSMEREGLMRLIREKTKDGGPGRGHRAGMRVRTNYEEHWRGPSKRKLSRLN